MKAADISPVTGMAMPAAATTITTPTSIAIAITANTTVVEGAGDAAYCAGLIEVEPISRMSLVTQLICRLYPLGVRVWKLL